MVWKPVRGQSMRKMRNALTANSLYKPSSEPNSDTTLIGVIASQEKRLSGSTVSVLPAECLDSAALAGIQSGDIIAFTTDIDGLDIAHVGIALNENGTVRLIHASSSQGAVVIEKRALTLQLRENRRFTGIRIIRPLNVTVRK